MKNSKLKSYLFENQLSQRKASKILSMDSSDFSKLLKYELSEAEQDKMIETIRQHLQERENHNDHA
ncbi:MAG: helix-turn-helix domain-containing protein [Solobacterium sp.]|nr:helix-turn-helix domain-containing protein [Solobacterium sp.]